MTSSYKFHHLGVAVPDLDAAVACYQALFSYRPTSPTYEDPIQKVRVCFLEVPGAVGSVLELVSPRGPDSPINRFLENGVAAYHLCFEVEDLDSALQQLRAQRCLVLGKPAQAVAFAGRRICWLYSPVKQLIELVESTARV